jgi:serine/threonine-protein phosphatase 2A activator
MSKFIPVLRKLDNSSRFTFEKPVKKIHDGADVSFFFSSLAYRDIVTFMLQLNRSMVPRKIQIDGKSAVQSWPIGSTQVVFSDAVNKLRALMKQLEIFISEAPPDTGPRRFGNVSFRKWHKLVEERIADLLKENMPSDILAASEEVEMYLLGSFGSPQRLDYGTGHELSFLAFLGCLWKLNFFQISDPGVEERGIVLGVFQPYLSLVRKLIKTYTLEPAGSHGVWGLDDNSFLPYVFGSAQLCPAIEETDDTPIEGSLPDSPEPSSVAKANIVEKEQDHNMYFSAIAFIFDVKRGPFWEHSPMLFDISGLRDGWGKINKGMVKMYNAEVLSKFPVVQHFPFGSLFKWEIDPDATLPVTTTHTASQPLRNPTDLSAPKIVRPGAIPQMGAGTAAPWAARPAPPPVGMVDGVTRAPWTTSAPPPRSGFNSRIGPPRPVPVANPRQPPLAEVSEESSK